jgi:hypothetical protein
MPATDPQPAAAAVSALFSRPTPERERFSTRMRMPRPGRRLVQAIGSMR